MTKGMMVRAIDVVHPFLKSIFSHTDWKHKVQIRNQAFGPQGVFLIAVENEMFHRLLYCAEYQPRPVVGGPATGVERPVRYFILCLNTACRDKQDHQH